MAYSVFSPFRGEVHSADRTDACMNMTQCAFTASHTLQCDILMSAGAIFALGVQPTLMMDVPSVKNDTSSS